MHDEQRLGQFISLIDKMVRSVITDTDHVVFREDVSQDAILKLYRSGYLEENNMDSADDVKRVSAYIRLTVKSCYTDYLARNGINRRRTDNERCEGDTKYIQHEHETINDPDNPISIESEAFTAQQLVEAREAYEVIAYCFQNALILVKESERQRFYQAVFWELDEYNMTVKDLAAHVGYANSNPTQDFNRFVKKVSECTEKDGIKVVNPSEQVDFLKQILSLDEAV